MKAILVQSDKSLTWSDVPDPVIKPDEVLVKVHYTAINRADLMQRDGDYPPPPGCPDWMGLEISGTIQSMGEEAIQNSTYKIGDQVCALLGGGGYAEYAAVRYDMLMPVPQNCSLAEAATMPEAFATAYLNLFIEGKMKPGDTLLMQGGRSGLASVIIPMAKAFGARVITTVRKEEHVDLIRHLNADIVVDTSKQNLVDVLKQQMEEGHPVDISIDCVGGENMGSYLPYLSHGARWIMIAALSGRDTTIDLKNIYVRNVRIIGSTLRSRTPQVKAQILASLVKEVWPKVETGEVRASIDCIMPITEAEAAQDILLQRRNIGKVVMQVC